MNRSLLFILLSWLFASPLLAADPGEYLPDAAKEARAQTLFKEIRCVVCSGQSIHDSNAIIAHDMRAEIRFRIMRGQSDSEIKSFLTERYGDGILMTPPVKASTALLWLGPLLLLAIGAYIIRVSLRRKHRKRPA